jgi:hypothetical protein
MYITVTCIINKKTEIYKLNNKQLICECLHKQININVKRFLSLVKNI